MAQIANIFLVGLIAFMCFGTSTTSPLVESESEPKLLTEIGNYHSKSYYTDLTTTMSWDAAYDFCAKSNKDLVEVLSLEELNELNTLMQANIPGTHIKEGWTRGKQSPNYLYDGATIVEYPIVRDYENCLTVKSSSTFHTAPCGRLGGVSLYAICQSVSSVNVN